MQVRGQARHWLIRLGGGAGAALCVYLLVESFFSKESIFCAPFFWLDCGAVDVLWGMPWLKPLNAVLGLGALAYFSYCGFRLPQLGPEAVRFRRRLLILTNVGLGYALLFRALDIVLGNQLCLPCALMFGCMVVVALGVWRECAHDRADREKLFVAEHFYGDMLKLSVVLVLVSFAGTYSLRGLAPLPAKETLKNLRRAGFDPDASDVITTARAGELNYLLFIYEGNCLPSYRQSLTFLQPEIMEVIQNFPKTIANVEGDPTNALLEFYELEGSPSLVLIDIQSNDAMVKFVGEQSAEQLIEGFAELAVAAEDSITSGPGR